MQGPSSDKLRRALRVTFNLDATLFASGRESLLALLRAIDVRSGEEIIVQGYTCVVVPNAISAAGATAVFADIDPDTLNLMPETVEPLITPRTRAIICQHTFGIPANTVDLRSLCDKHKLFLIEDCAHVLPDSKGPSSVGKLGDALILSFGRDKAISGIAGGAVLTKHPKHTAILRELERSAVSASFWSVMKLLEYPSRMRNIVRPLSGTFLFKPALWLLNQLGMVVPIVTEQEKKGRMSPILTKIPNMCAELALYSLKKLPVLNERRRTLTSFFLSHGQKNNWPILGGMRADLPLQKFPLFVHDAEVKRSLLKKENIHLDDGWTGCVICPDSVDMNYTDYLWGSDPIAEQVCMQILSLPVHPTMTLFQAQMLARRIDKLLKA